MLPHGRRRARLQQKGEDGEGGEGARAAAKVVGHARLEAWVLGVLVGEGEEGGGGEESEGREGEQLVSEADLVGVGLGVRVCVGVKMLGC